MNQSLLQQFIRMNNTEKCLIWILIEQKEQQFKLCLLIVSIQANASGTKVTMFNADMLIQQNI